MSRRVLVAVAHPDDESLWAGGYLIEHPGTHVLCCSIPSKDPERVLDFYRACELLGANGFVCGKPSAKGRIDMEAAILFASHYDQIITHNHVGEYGHSAHMVVHRHMKALDKPMRVFGYGLTREGQELSDAQWDLKRKAIELYKSRPKVFENQSKNFNLRRETFL